MVSPEPAKPMEPKLLLASAIKDESLSDSAAGELAEWTGENPASAFFGVTRENAVDVVLRRWADLRAFASDLAADSLVLTDQRIEISFGPEQVWHYYLPLARWLSERSKEKCAAGRRFIIGVAGIGASGKTMFCEVLSRILGRMLESEGVSAKTIPLDGYHYPSGYLNSHHAVSPDGVVESLRVLKGMVMTYDAAKARRELCRLRSGCPRQSAGAPLLFPAYSRVLHEPVEGQIAVTGRDLVVLVEGNYVLLEQGEWDAVRRLFDVSFFVSVPRSAARRVMIPRLARGHWTEEVAAERYDAVDAHNADLILSAQRNADVIVERDERFRIVNMGWNPLRPA